MARKRRRATPALPRDTSVRGKIVNAFMALLAERPLGRIGFAEIAARAGVALADVRGEFDSIRAILAEYVKEVDRAVLAGVDPEMAEEPARERLFDVLRRLELLAPHKQAIRSLMRSALLDPLLAVELNALTARSMQWMLTAANIGAAGPKGMVRAQGLALLFANLLRTWVDDEEPHSRTLAALDRALARGERWSGLLDELFRIPERCLDRTRRPRERARASRRGGDEERMAA